MRELNTIKIELDTHNSLGPKERKKVGEGFLVEAPSETSPKSELVLSRRTVEKSLPRRETGHQDLWANRQGEGVVWE